MPARKKQKSNRPSKRLYVYMAFVTMVVVHFFTKPFKRGLSSLSRRLKKSSKRSSIRAQLKLGQEDFNQPVFVKKSNPKKKNSYQIS